LGGHLSELGLQISLNLGVHTMGKKTEKLRRVVNKLTNKYGPKDADVLRLQSELNVLESLESHRPERRSYKTADFKFQTPAKQLFFRSGEQAEH
jgi:hypothetical protein